MGSSFVYMIIFSQSKIMHEFPILGEKCTWSLLLGMNLVFLKCGAWYSRHTSHTAAYLSGLGEQASIQVYMDCFDLILSGLF